MRPGSRAPACECRTRGWWCHHGPHQRPSHAQRRPATTGDQRPTGERRARRQRAAGDAARTSSVPGQPLLQPLRAVLAGDREQPVVAPVAVDVQVPRREAVLRGCRASPRPAATRCSPGGSRPRSGAARARRSSGRPPSRRRGSSGPGRRGPRRSSSRSRRTAPSRGRCCSRSAGRRTRRRTPPRTAAAARPAPRGASRAPSRRRCGAGRRRRAAWSRPTGEPGQCCAGGPRARHADRRRPAAAAAAARG